MLQFPEHIDRVAWLAEVSELRHRVISHNLANVNTPGYQRLDVRFDDSLAQASQAESTRTTAEPTVATDPEATPRTDGNTVDIDREIGHLNKNAMLFQMYTQILRHHLNMMQQAVRR